MTDAPILRTRGLRASVGNAANRRCLFEDMDAEFAPGTLTAVIGPNGAGKSTLLEMLCGLQRPNAGVIELRGQRLADIEPRTRAQTIAFLPQSTELHFDLGVADVVMLGRRPHRSRLGLPGPADRRRVDEALEQVDATALRSRQIRSLSGGERQRVMLARMLATEASILILDEPNTGLDIGHALEMMQLLGRLRDAQKTIITALHDLVVVDRIASHVICLDPAGPSHAVGTAAEVMSPQRLGSVFGVDVERGVDDSLRFSLRRGMTQP